MCPSKAYLPNIIPICRNKSGWKGGGNYGETGREGNPSLQNLLKSLTSWESRIIAQLPTAVEEVAGTDDIFFLYNMEIFSRKSVFF